MTQALTSLYAGDTLSLTRPPSGRPPSDGWVLKAKLIPRSGAAGTVALTGAAGAGDQHELTVAPAVTAVWPAGAYSLTLWVERGSDVYTVDTVQLDVLPNPRTATAAIDTRTLAERTLADLKAAFASWSSTRGMQRKYRINEREMEFASADEILKLISYWEGAVAKEMEAARRAAGGKPRNKIKVRFTRVR